MRKAFLFLSIITICLVSGCANAQQPQPNKPSGSAGAQKPSPNKRILVAYFSRSGNTREIANQIHAIVGGDIFEIQTAKPYPDDYEAVVKQAAEERESGYKPPLKSKVQDIRSYDVIFIGFPIWGMAIPSPIRSFLSDYDLSGKTVVPFCTHGGYGPGQSFNTVKELSPRSNLLESFAIEGKRAAMAQPEVRKWLQEIKLIEESPAQAAPPATIRAETKAYTNSIGMEFIAIPAGSFMMGAGNSDPDAISSEKPQHEVTISKPFSIGKYEVTQAQWEAVMGSNPYTLDRSNPYYNLPGMKERITRPTHPATVSWNDAQEFIRRLNAKEGHNCYRLPTEAEWEYAARAGTTTAYSFGDNIRDLGRYAWYGEDFASGGTHPVGQKLPNLWGLYDVHGNAWEWVQDWYGENYYAQSLSTDPKGPASGSQRVVRGGSWHQTATSWRSSFRKAYEPDYRGISIGFRIVMTAE